MVPRARLPGRRARPPAARALVAWLVASSLALARALAPHPHRRLDVRPTALREHLTRGRAVGPGGFPGDAPEERWVTQPLDHFDPSDVVAADAQSSGREARDAADDAERHLIRSDGSPPPKKENAGRTWRQRWFANDAFFDRARFRSPGTDTETLPDPVVFLCVGGEGPGFDPDVVVTGGPHCALAARLAQTLFEKKKGGALLVALEHRFYGASQPTGDLTTESLRYLTSDQALADAARFVREVTEVFGLAKSRAGGDLLNPPSSPPTFQTQKSLVSRAGNERASFPRVVAFGGSYPGMLAGWLRVKYPHLFVAAVASSAPVRASLAMPGYDFVVGEALAETDVGGSETCLWRVALAFGEVSRLMRSYDGRRTLEEMFDVCGSADRRTKTNETKTKTKTNDDDESQSQKSSSSEYPLEPPENRAEFFAALTEVFPAQSNDPACDRSANAACDIGGACAIMTNFSSGEKGTKDQSPSDRSAKDQSLRNLAATARAAFGADRCVDCDHAGNVRFLNVTSLPADVRRDYDGDRAWFWQTCVEFGFYQTCSDARCPFYSAEVSENGFPDDVSSLSLAFFAKPCASVFGLDLERVVFPAANRSNLKTGGVFPGGSRIMYPSGSVDPWRANSFTPELAGSVPHRSERAVKKTLPALMVAGASHHAWTHPPRKTDQESVVKAREAIAAQVEKWLEETDVTSEEGRVVEA